MKPSFKDRKPASNTEIRNYFQILKDDPRSRVFAPLAEALIRRGRLQEAEKICALGLEANPDFSDGHLANARVMFYSFKYQESLKEVKVALGLDPKSTEAYLIAAEIFLARSQHKAASDACLRVIDLEPDNGEARRILDRLSSSDKVPLPKRAEVPSRPNTAQFRATAGTAPSRRLIEPQEPRTLTNPFRQLLEEVGMAAEKQLDLSEQPFSAPPPDVPTKPMKREVLEGFEVPTLKDRSSPPSPPVPQLPARPPAPGSDPGALSLLEMVSDANSIPAPAAPSPAPILASPWPVQSSPAPAFAETEPAGPSVLPTIDAVQAIIDSYSGAGDSDLDDSGPLRMPRSNRKLLLLVLLALLGGVGLVIVFGTRAEVERQTNRATDASAASLASADPLGPPPPPKLPESDEDRTGGSDESPPPAGMPSEPGGEAQATAGDAGSEGADAGAGETAVDGGGLPADPGPAIDQTPASKKPAKPGKGSKRPTKRPGGKGKKGIR